MIYFSCKKVEMPGTKYPSLCRYVAEGTDLWKGVNNKMPIHLKRKNGEVTPYKNSEFIPAYYFIPKEAMTKLPRELQELPRNPWFIFRDWDAIAVVESDLFLQLMIDGFAQFAWPYMGMGPDMEIYSGYDPVYLTAHNCSMWIQTMTDLGMIPTVEELFKNVQPWEHFGWLPLGEAQWKMRQIVRATMHRYNLKEAFEEIKQKRCFEDFDDCYSTQKIDLHRKWYHTRTKHPQVSLDGMREKLEEEHEGLDWEAPDESQNLETSVVDVAAGQAFLQTLDHKDAMILTLRNHGFTLEEIADELGYTNHTGVLKRIKKIGAAYQAFAGVDIGF